MNSSLLSILTLYKFDMTLFDAMEIPEGVDRDCLVNNLLMELAEFEVIYPEPEFMKFAIEMWSKKEVAQWSKLYVTTQLDYNPIENYNRTENISETETRDLEMNESRALESTSKVDSTTSGNASNTGTDSNSVFNKAFNNADDVLTERQDNTLGSQTDTTGKIDTTETFNDGGSINKDDKGTIKMEKSNNIFGNIGVTTTQQMIEQERDSVKFNIYDYIIDAFKGRFCILVY